MLPETKKDQFGGFGRRADREEQILLLRRLPGLAEHRGRIAALDRAHDGGPHAATCRAYGVNIYDPLTGDPTQRQQFPGNVIPSGRLSPQAQNLLNLLPLPNAAGTQNGTRNNYIAQGSESFNGDQFNTRLDGRLSDSLNTFARYSYAKYASTGRWRSARAAARRSSPSAGNRR